MLFQAFVILAVCGIVFGEAVESQQSGDRNATIDEVPWHASIELLHDDGVLGHLFSGAVIGPQLVVVDARAFPLYPNRTFVVRVGSKELKMVVKRSMLNVSSCIPSLITIH